MAARAANPSFALRLKAMASGFVLNRSHADRLEIDPVVHVERRLRLDVRDDVDHGQTALHVHVEAERAVGRRARAGDVRPVALDDDRLEQVGEGLRRVVEAAPQRLTGKRVAVGLEERAHVDGIQDDRLDHPIVEGVDHRHAPHATVIGPLALGQGAGFVGARPVGEELGHVGLGPVGGDRDAAGFRPLKTVRDAGEEPVVRRVDDEDALRREIGDEESGSVRFQGAAERLGADLDRLHDRSRRRVDHGDGAAALIGDVDLRVVGGDGHAPGVDADRDLGQLLVGVVQHIEERDGIVVRVDAPDEAIVARDRDWAGAGGAR